MVVYKMIEITQYEWRKLRQSDIIYSSYTFLIKESEYYYYRDQKGKVIIAMFIYAGRANRYFRHD